jgi:hypothetical protein
MEICRTVCDNRRRVPVLVDSLSSGSWYGAVGAVGVA